VRAVPSLAGLSEVRITGNRFRRDAAQQPIALPPTAQLSDNTFVDGGSAIAD
jgi:hypothetical protein